MYLIFILTSCEYFHVDIAKEMHLNDRDFQHKREKSFYYAHGALECCFSIQISCLLASELTIMVPSVHMFFTSLLSSQDIGLLFGGKSRMVTVFHLAVDFSRLNLHCVAIQKRNE